MFGTVFLFVPAVRALECDIHQKRSLLLLLPIEVVSCTPSIEALIRKILAEADVAAGSVGQRSDDNASIAGGRDSRRESRVEIEVVMQGEAGSSSSAEDLQTAPLAGTRAQAQ